MPGLHLHVAASPAATWLALFSRGSLSCFPRAGEMGAKEGGTEHGRDSDHHAGSTSQCESATYARSRLRLRTYPCSLTGSSLSTPMGSGVRSSVPSSVKPAVSSVTYFSHSAATLEQCLAPILV